MYKTAVYALANRDIQGLKKTSKTAKITKSDIARITLLRVSDIARITLTVCQLLWYFAVFDV